jgi:hypothetical protein
MIDLIDETPTCSSPRLRNLEKSYTKHCDEKIDQIIACQVSEISSRIIKEVDDVISLFLIGGYARGEGSVLVEKDGIVPLGDYDFLVISRFPHYPIEFSWVKSLQKKFRVQYHIGTSIVWEPSLPFLGKRIYWYEMKFGSRLLFGSEKVLDLIRISDGSEVSVNEGLSLMFNRLMGLLRVFDISLLTNKPNRRQREDLIFQSVKLILSCGESLLLLDHRYHFSYEERLRRLSRDIVDQFSGLLRVDPSLKEDYEKSTCFKLEPKYEMYNDAVKFWFDAKRHLLLTLSFFMRWKTLGANVSASRIGAYGDPQYLAGLLLQAGNQELGTRALDFAKFNWNAIRQMKSLGGLRLNRPLYSNLVRTSLFYLALSLQENGTIDNVLLDNALKTISTIIPVSSSVKQEKNLQKKWETARNITYFAWKIVRQ